VADAPLKAAEVERHLAAVVVVVTPAAADPAVVGILPAAAVEVTPVAAIRMEGATKIELTLTARCLRAARFFLLTQFR
jgi:hypothetical protein